MLRAEKKAIRAEVNAALLRVSSAKRRKMSQHGWELLSQTKAWCESRAVMLYAPMKVEPDMDLGWESGALDGKIVGYPRIDGHNLLIAIVRSPAELAPGAFGLREPGLRAELISPEQLDLIVVPGLAFTRAGDRLGRGAGYYDRFLATVPARVATIALIFPCQLRDRLPMEPHDRRVGSVIIC
jgi:5-formyltetrahydrofolate cyclo-ligase